MRCKGILMGRFFCNLVYGPDSFQDTCLLSHFSICIHFQDTNLIFKTLCIIFKTLFIFKTLIKRLETYLMHLEEPSWNVVSRHLCTFSRHLHSFSRHTYSFQDVTLFSRDQVNFSRLRARFSRDISDFSRDFDVLKWRLEKYLMSLERPSWTSVLKEVSWWQFQKQCVFKTLVYFFKKPT